MYSKTEPEINVECVLRPRRPHTLNSCQRALSVKERALQSLSYFERLKTGISVPAFLTWPSMWIFVSHAKTTKLTASADECLSRHKTNGSFPHFQTKYRNRDVCQLSLSTHRSTAGQVHFSHGGGPGEARCCV